MITPAIKMDRLDVFAEELASLSQEDRARLLSFFLDTAIYSRNEEDRCQALTRVRVIEGMEILREQGKGVRQ